MNHTHVIVNANNTVCVIPLGRRSTTKNKDKMTEKIICPNRKSSSKSRQYMTRRTSATGAMRAAKMKNGTRRIRNGMFLGSSI